MARRYAETGHLPIDNNPVENCIRPIMLSPLLCIVRL
ncbi:IS66 family transposase [Methylovulum psychrotolerans]|nr:IS66 family transposase [Methylovulum psychrotolerans]